MRITISRETFRQRYVVAGDGCWMWTGAKDRHGYGRFGHSTLAHRWSFTQFVGPIPEGMQIDHLCCTPLCVNPGHLEPVTQAENMRRRTERQTHCANGHQFDESNTYRWGGRRFCRACNRMNTRKSAERRQLVVTP